jgi:two-component sensor histidine kinase
VAVLVIPVRLEGEVIAVLTREAAPTLGRQPGELEAMYVEVFNRFAKMLTTGEFPFAAEDASEEAPRVGDGAVVLDRDGRVEYASPNAVSALHRIGVHANAEGMRLSELGLEDVAVRTSFAIGAPVTEEIERGPEVTVLVRCLPLLDEGQVTGALVLLRDISELRRRDRLLISMDATIREIHHRVKNNLQTISSLLRLQGRRLESPEAKGAIEESCDASGPSPSCTRRSRARSGTTCRSARSCVRSSAWWRRGCCPPSTPSPSRSRGTPASCRPASPPPLAVVLNELLQNTVDHAFPAGAPSEQGHVLLTMANDGAELVVRVVDDGVGLPTGFSVDSSKGLGLSIVRSLVTSQVEGTITMRSRPLGVAPAWGGPGTEIEIRVPVIGGAA